MRSKAMNKNLSRYNLLMGRLLRCIRYFNKKDPFKEFITLRINESVPPITKGTILILPFRVSPISNLFEGIIGYSFRLRGYNPVALLCGKILNYCDNVSIADSKFISCSLCLSEQARFASCFAIKSDYFSNLISNKRKSQLKQIAYSVDLADIQNYTFSNVPIGKHVFSAVQRYTLSCEPSLHENEILFREFLLSSLITLEVTRNAIKKYNPTLILLSHGVYSTWGTAMEVALRDGVRCVTWGRGYIGGNIILAHDASYLEADRIERNNFWRMRELTKPQVDIVLKYLQLKQAFDADVDQVCYYKRVEQLNKNEVLKSLRLEPKRKRIGMYPNIPWDGQTYSNSEAFPRFLDWVRSTIEWFKENPQVDLIIRAHPAEKRLKTDKTLETFESILRKSYPRLPENVRFIGPERDEISSYLVSSVCEAAIMYGSTLGIEFAVSGHPVINAGKWYWSDKGILFDVQSPEHYRSLLEEASVGNLKMSDSMKQNAIKFAYYWFFNRHVPETVIHLKGIEFSGYKISASSELAPGGNEIIDWLVDCCINCKPFIWIKDNLKW